MEKLKGKTALITGASSGIGEAIPRKLAEAGVNLVLVSRSQDKLPKLGDELNKLYGVGLKVFAIDLSVPKVFYKFAYTTRIK